MLGECLYKSMKNRVPKRAPRKNVEAQMVQLGLTGNYARKYANQHGWICKMDKSR